jgi:prophage DNA circulation protein
MNFKLSIVATGMVLCVLTAPAFAVDFEYFKNQSCQELGKELDALKKAETVVNDGIKKKDSDANVKAAVGFLLTGWPFWGTSDHGNANNQLQEIREDIRFVTRAQKANKCPA